MAASQQPSLSAAARLAFGGEGEGWGGIIAAVRGWTPDMGAIRRVPRRIDGREAATGDGRGLVGGKESEITWR